MAKKIPDIIYNFDVPHQKYVKPSPLATQGSIHSYKGQAPDKASVEIYAKIETGDRVWAYSLHHKSWFHGIAFEKRPDTKIGVFNTTYCTYNRASHNACDGRFWTDRFRIEPPEGIVHPSFPDIILPTQYEDLTK